MDIEEQAEITATASPTATATGEANVALTSEGVLDVTATATATGDGGAREIEVSAAQQIFDGLHENLDLGEEAGLVVSNATDWVIELFKHRPKPWDQLSQAEQRDLVAGIEENVHELVRHVVEAVARTGRDAVRCLFVGFTDKGDDIKAELKVKAYSKEETEQAVIALHRARGKHVLVTVATAEDFHEVPANDRSQPDQPALEFEAGTDERPDDDSDLAAEDLARKPALPVDTTEIVRTGDQLLGPQGLLEARINTQTQMLEGLAAGADRETGWQDVRPASPGELAEERERTADFADAD